MVATRGCRGTVAPIASDAVHFVHRILRELSITFIAALAIVPATHALTLDEDRAEALFHYYDGGGVEVSGPAILVRKGVGAQTAVTAGYYADSISSASIDVVTTASPYSEQRDEYQFGVEHLSGDSRMSLSYTDSEESDYIAKTIAMDLTHEVFGGLSTFSMGYAREQDVVGRVDTSETDTKDSNLFRLGASQILSSRMVASATYEIITDDGLLNNPYRAARVLGAFLPERYPRTRTSNTVAVHARYALGQGGRPDPAALRASYRYFFDTWGIGANTVELGAAGYLGVRWRLDGWYRYYSQNAAVFYSDNFADEEIFMARDKELSTFQSHTLGMSGTYALARAHATSRIRADASASLYHVIFDYHDFTDVRDGQPYSFSANVAQLYLSIWY